MLSCQVLRAVVHSCMSRAVVVLLVCLVKKKKKKKKKKKNWPHLKQTLSRRFDAITQGQCGWFISSNL